MLCIWFGSEISSTLRILLMESSWCLAFVEYLPKYSIKSHCEHRFGDPDRRWLNELSVFILIAIENAFGNTVNTCKLLVVAITFNHWNCLAQYFCALGNISMVKPNDTQRQKLSHWVCRDQTITVRTCALVFGQAALRMFTLKSETKIRAAFNCERRLPFPKTSIKLAQFEIQLFWREHANNQQTRAFSRYLHSGQFHGIIFGLEFIWIQDKPRPTYLITIIESDVLIWPR